MPKRCACLGDELRLATKKTAQLLPGVPIENLLTVEGEFSGFGALLKSENNTQKSAVGTIHFTAAYPRNFEIETIGFNLSEGFLCPL